MLHGSSLVSFHTYNSALCVVQLHLPLNSPLAGSELTKEPFRWDQRLFALVLRLPGAATPDNEQLGSVPTDESAITQMCEVTGGLHFLTLVQCFHITHVFLHLVVIFNSCSPLFSLRTIILCTDTKDVEPVSGVSGPEGSKWGCP